MSLLEQLAPASYKGVPFLVTSGRIAGGRRDVKHLYPNSDRQVIEDLGKSQRVFSVEAIITGDDDYVQNRDRLLTVLEEGGAGPLVHPLYGQYDNIVARTYTLLEDLTELGSAKFSITFEVTGELGVPTQAVSTVNKVQAGSDAFLSGVREDIEDNFLVTSSFTGNFSAAIDKLDAVVDAFNANTSLLQAEAGKINAFSKEVSDFSANITALIQAPANLATSLTSLFDTVAGLYPTAEATVNVLVGFFPFGDDDTTINETTAIKVERAKNNRLINQSMQSLALSQAYVSVADIDFETATEVTAKAALLEKQYQAVVSSEGLTTETKALLTDLRSTMQAFFDEQALNASQVLTVDTNLTSAQLLAYQYYGSSEKGEQLIELNAFEDVTFVEGAVQVVSA
jgi:prophage DNA circulation protein